MRIPKLKTRGVVCGSTTTMVVTLLIAGNFVPEGWKTPEAVAALTGLLATLSAAFGTCEWQSQSAARDDNDLETPQ